MIEICQNIWGASEIRGGNPRVSFYTDAVYIPFSDEDYLSDDAGWGIFDSAGQIVEAATYNRNAGADRVRVGQSMMRDLDLDCEVAEEPEYVYLGPMMQHYGHFITATLARLWFFSKRDRKIKFLIHSQSSIELLTDFPYFRDSLLALGISSDQVVRFQHPTRIKYLVVPHVSFEEQSFAYSAFGEMCRAIGQAYSAGGSPTNRPVYLSKERLSSGVSKIIDEATLSKTLAEMGVDIVYPELLTFPEQIRLFHDRKYIIGSGSGLHTAIFSNIVNNIIAINLTGSINSNFVIIDKLRNGNTHFVQPSNGCVTRHQPKQLQNFLRSMKETNADNFKKSNSRIIGNSAFAFMSLSFIEDLTGFARDLIAFLRSQGAELRDDAENLSR